ncbi:LysR family transcriptional regulator [Ramlibacter sp. AW1]|uniref:LysR family transcriptional regulator n=1 Tax=Ramlibacter aurantiacus TaxID=2801330 RepID=A0A936ZPY5_9BURK|nr:LysR family transcriptional regulator [Ramlibacter aurantiacus]MBL0421591.1 LysR family transcriptional regulator [Ramlibacter aurantiacus]
MESRKVEGLWNHLHWLTVLAEQGSYTAAAARLQVSKAAMSQRIAELEKAVGVPLVRRTTRSMQLTQTGQHLVSGIRASYDAIAQSFAGARDAAAEPQGLVRVTAPVALARQHLVPAVARFLAGHPSIRVELELSDRLSSMASEGFDLAIRHAAAAPDTHVAWELCRTTSVLVASPSYLERHPPPARPEDLAAHACLHYPRGRDEAVWSLERGAGTKAGRRVSVAVKGPLAANNSEVLRDAALEGLGIALIPDFSAMTLLQSGQLVRVLPAWRPTGTFADRIYALRPYAPQVPRAVDALVRHLRAWFDKGFAVPAAPKPDASPPVPAKKSRVR